MEKLFVSYVIAQRLKQAGFDEPCFGSYNFINELKISTDRVCSESQSMCKRIFGGISAQTYDQTTKWFRDKYNIHILYIVCGGSKKVLGYKWYVQIGMEKDAYETKMIKDYYVGMNEAIKEALKLI